MLFKQLLKPKQPNWQKFHHGIQNKKITPEKKYPPEWIKTYYKAYARMPSIKLPSPQLHNQMLKQTLEKRQSSRKHTQATQLNLQNLSTLLYYSLGEKNRPKDQHSTENHSQRFYPSGGARYPIEAYIIVRDVSGLKSGIYHYYPRGHLIEYLYVFSERQMRGLFINKFTQYTNCFIVLTGFFIRSTIKYGDRGYYYSLIESGHIGQNISLLASALNIGSCPVGGFIQKSMDELLDINDSEESTLYTFALH